MQNRQIDLGFLDDEPNVTVNLDFLDGKGPQDSKNDEWRKIQAERFPTAYELSGKESDRGRALPEPTKPVADAFLAGLPLANPALIWNDRVRGAFGRAISTGAKDLWGMAKMPFSLLSPAKTATALGEQRERSETAVGKAWQRGDYPFALTRGLLNMVPFGPGVGEQLDEAGVDPAAGAGHVAALAVAPKVMGDVANVVREAPGVARGIAKTGIKNALIDYNSRHLTPERQITMALRPKNTTLDFERQAETAAPLIKRAAENIGRPVTDIESLDVAREAALADEVARQKQLVGANEITASGKPIADAIKNSITTLFKKENPEAAKAIAEWADEVYDQDFTFEELDEMRKDGNAALRGYHGKLPVGQMELDRTMDTAIKVAKTRATRQLQIDLANKYSGTGDAIAQTNKNIGSLLTMEDIVDRRWNVEQRQALANLPQQVSRLMRFGKYGKAVKSLMSGHPGGAAIDVLTGMGEKALADFMREANSTSGQLASAFRRLTREPDPVNMNPVGRAQRGLGPAQSTVQPGTTGSATPGQPLEAQGWSRPSSMQMEQGLRDDEQLFHETGTGSMTQSMRDALKTPPGTGVEHVPGRGSSTGAQPAGEPDIDVDFEPVTSRQISAAPGGRLALPEETAGRETQANPMRAAKVAGETEAGPRGNRRGAPIRLKATKESRAAQAAYEKAINGKIAEDAGFYIDRHPNGQFRKVYTGFTDALKNWNEKKGQKGAVPIKWDKASAVELKDRPLPGEDMAGFLTADGKWVKLKGNYGHPDAILNSIPEKMKNYEELINDDEYGESSDPNHEAHLIAENTYEELGLIRIGRFSDGALAVQVHKMPTSSQLSEITKAIKERPNMKAWWDIVDNDSDTSTSGHGTGRELLTALRSMKKDKK